jgi:hypothetical protein
VSQAVNLCELACLHCGLFNCLALCPLGTEQRLFSGQATGIARQAAIAAQHAVAHPGVAMQPASSAALPVAAQPVATMFPVAVAALHAVALKAPALPALLAPQAELHTATAPRADPAWGNAAPTCAALAGADHWLRATLASCSTL